MNTTPKSTTEPEGPEPSDTGSALVELAIVSSLLVVLIVGTFEIGMGWTAASRVTQAARTGARTASQLGPDPNADQRTLEAAVGALGPQAGNLVRVIIYDAGSADGKPTAGCRTAQAPGVSDQCSVYGPAEAAAFSQGAWPPANRSDGTATADYIGVTVEINHRWLSGLIGQGTFVIDETVVMRVEPDFGD